MGAPEEEEDGGSMYTSYEECSSGQGWGCTRGKWCATRVFTVPGGPFSLWGHVLNGQNHGQLIAIIVSSETESEKKRVQHAKHHLATWRTEHVRRAAPYVSSSWSSATRPTPAISGGLLRVAAFDSFPLSPLKCIVRTIPLESEPDFCYVRLSLIHI